MVWHSGLHATSSEIDGAMSRRAGLGYPMAFISLSRMF
jgi:hypothetical protein